MKPRTSDVGGWLPGINLLPWRAARRRAHRRRFFALLALCILLAAGCVLNAHTVLSIRLTAQNQRNQLLQQQINDLQSQPLMSLDPPPTSDDIRWLEHWLSQRAHVAVILERLAGATPQGVVLTAFRQDSPASLIEGQALSATDVRAFEHALSQEPLWRSVERIEASATTAGQRPVQTFSLRVAPSAEAQ